jgi:hypothetical protein
MGESMNQEKEVSFLPFHAINEFMTTEYKKRVIVTSLEALPNLPPEYRTPVNKIIKKSVRVPGFRNSLAAPLSLKVKPVMEVFEKNPGFVAQILNTWSEIQSVLRGQVYKLLVSRDWDLLPVEANRTRLPGFLTIWPGGEDFGTLYESYSEIYPESLSSSDDVSLMVVWLSGRLPYQFENDEI